ncbi:amidohydrolase family protein [Prochlorococcus sp. MIT 1341]|uniref:amidohydrolase family protein n=1 Tax=Prochlorococcus sp. MIT 1341 TaxID=3096221 RepID=UPI002A75824F|nr:amidohydrolase family protein [Prochlorococcus sp. MIT 1341]
MNELEALVPRSLIVLDRGGSCLVGANFEGLSHIRLGWDSGFIRTIEEVKGASSSPGQLLLPRLIEPHAHLDKAFSWPDYHNFSGHYFQALTVNHQEHKVRSKQCVLERSERAIKLAVGNGIRAIRTHIDSFGDIRSPSWEALVDIKNQWKQKIEIQLVALTPIDFWGTNSGRHMAKDIAKSGGLIGGVVPSSPRRASLRKDLKKMLIIADELGCGVDLHIDESHENPAFGVKSLLSALDDLRITIPITCSHLSSLSLLPPSSLLRIAERIALHGVSVVAMPLTNSWLLGGRRCSNPSVRPVAPICALQKAGVSVAVGGDNVQDPWFPAGNFDPLALMGFSLPISQLAPWERLGLAPFTTSAAQIMGLSWEGSLQIGSPADFVLLEADGWAAALATPPKRKVMIGGSWLDSISKI